MAQEASSMSKVICFHCRRRASRCFPGCATALRKRFLEPPARRFPRRWKVGIGFAGAALLGALLGGALALVGC
jgi:hypothetical protein